MQKCYENLALPLPYYTQYNQPFLVPPPQRRKTRKQQQPHQKQQLDNSKTNAAMFNDIDGWNSGIGVGGHLQHAEDEDICINYLRVSKAKEKSSI
jgi:hypothetical protein